MKPLKLVPDVFKPISKNIMTPDVLAYYKVADGWAELSQGEGMTHEPIWGVTVRPGPQTLSRLFHSYAKAMDYIEELRP